MGRGSKSQRRLAEQQLNLERGRVEEERARRGAGEARILPEIEKFTKTPGLTEEEERQFEQERLGGISNVWGARRQEAAARRARTGSTAGYYDWLSESGREEGREKEGAVRRLGLDKFGLRRQDEVTGLQALMNLYGIDANLLSRISGLPYEALGARAQGIAPGFWDYLTPIIGGGAQAAGAYYGAKGAKG